MRHYLNESAQPKMVIFKDKHASENAVTQFFQSDSQNLLQVTYIILFHIVMSWVNAYNFLSS